MNESPPPEARVIPPVEAARLRGHVTRLAGEIGERNVFLPEALNQARTYISSQWSEQGYTVVEQRYETKGVSCANLEVSLPGHAHPEHVILVGAHYDSVAGSPGANDNASGVAAMLELSRVLSGSAPAHSLRFVAFVNEEPPFFFWKQMGSMHYAQTARARGDDIALMLSLETLGCYSDEPGSQRYPPLFRFFFPDRGNFVAFVSNLKSRRAMHRTVAAFRAASDFPVEHVATFSWVPGVAWSDHLSFWREGYRALMVTDTAFYRYAHYHQPTDTPDRLDYDRLAWVVQGLAGALHELDEAGVER
jgi:Zn-dependent M28 family amino/carboxypeptidase